MSSTCLWGQGDFRYFPPAIPSPSPLQSPIRHQSLSNHLHIWFYFWQFDVILNYAPPGLERLAITEEQREMKMPKLVSKTLASLLQSKIQQQITLVMICTLQFSGIDIRTYLSQKYNYLVFHNFTLIHQKNDNLIHQHKHSINLILSIMCIDHAKGSHRDAQNILPHPFCLSLSLSLNEMKRPEKILLLVVFIKVVDMFCCQIHTNKTQNKIISKVNSLDSYSLCVEMISEDSDVSFSILGYPLSLPISIVDV